MEVKEMTGTQQPWCLHLPLKTLPIPPFSTLGRTWARLKASEAPATVAAPGFLGRAGPGPVTKY